MSGVGLDAVTDDFLDPEEAVDLSNCEREPIHIPGAIQPHGVVVSLDPETLTVRQASANADAVFGRAAGEIVGARLDELLDAGVMGAVRGALAALSAGDETPVPVAVTLEAGGVWEVAVHRSNAVVVCEFEMLDQSGGLDHAAFVTEVSAAMVAMQGASGVVEVSDRAVVEIKRLTGYDRVMVYTFDDDGHGEVIAEAREPALRPFLGHHYPATDIPSQARALYLRQTIRVIVDINYEPVPMEPRHDPRTGEELDLGQAQLRSVSPIHIEYLRNMGVTGTLTISLKRDGELWGMIVCHHSSPRHPSSSVRRACEFLGELLSFQFAREEEIDLARERSALRLKRVELLSLVRGAGDLAWGLREGSAALLELCDADGISIALDDERIVAGTVPEADVEALMLAQLASDGTPLVLDRIPTQLAEVAARTDICGCLAVTLPRGVGQHIVWYRREWRHELTWGGDPGDSVAPDLTATAVKSLSPRRSFEGWSQAVLGRSRPWRTVQVEVASELRRALAEHVVAAIRDQLAHVALHDSLTGLPNRTLLMETLGQILRRRGRDVPEYVGLLFLDVDNFKLINDSYGHAVGDDLLRQTGERISDALRGSDICVRLGGDEFVAVLQGINSPDELRLATDRVQARFERPFALDGSETVVTVSIGTALSVLSSGITPSQLLRDADTAMYEAKRRGRGRSVEFHAELDESRRRRVELERTMPGAMERNELLLEYQPLFTASGAVAGLEALVRWENPALGRVTPGEFIPIAEEIGLIDVVGTWVLDTAFRRLAALRAAGAPDVMMTVNLSASQLGDITLPSRLGVLLRELDIPPELACVEVTESLLVSSIGPSVNVLERIRGLGVKVAIDDFGTGFSSLAYLRRLPADLLKIDRAFVAELAHESVDSQIVAAVIDLARRLSIQTVAEGVETEEQLAILRDLGCDLIQGFLLARPTPSEALDGLLRVASSG